MFSKLKSRIDDTTSTALHSSFDLLKFAGGATLSAISPPLLGLSQNLYELIPIRLKDWNRIFISVIGNFFTVILSTRQGKTFLGKARRAGSSGVEAASTEKARNVVVESAVSFVKLAEALSTPEAKECIHQNSLLWCRFLDGCSTSQTKQFIYDLSDALWAFLQLAADPVTTSAIAQVTANLCHTLEMEDKVHSPQLRKVMDNETKSKRRRDRAEYAAAVRRTPHDTCESREEPLYDAEEEIDYVTAAAAVTGNIDVPTDLAMPHVNSPSNLIHQHLKSTDLTDLQANGATRIDNIDDIEDLASLTDHDGITETDNRHLQNAVSGENHGSCDDSSMGLHRNPQTRNTPGDRDGDEHPFPPERKPKQKINIENPISLFYKTLDQTILVHREAVLNSILKENPSGEQQENESRELVNPKWFPKAAAAAGGGNEHGQDTIHLYSNKNRRHYCHSHAGIGVGSTPALSSKYTAVQSADKKQSQKPVISFLLVICGIILIFCFLWFWLGCYGLYCLLFSSSFHNNKSEVIIRVIREVAYVSSMESNKTELLASFNLTDEF